MTPAEQAAYAQGQREMRERAADAYRCDYAALRPSTTLVLDMMRARFIDALPLTPAPAPEPPRCGNCLHWSGERPQSFHPCRHPERTKFIGLNTTFDTRGTFGCILHEPLPAPPQEPV